MHRFPNQAFGARWRVAVLMVGSLKKGVLSFPLWLCLPLEAVISDNQFPSRGSLGRGTNEKSAAAGAEVLAVHEIAIFFDYR